MNKSLRVLILSVALIGSATSHAEIIDLGKMKITHYVSGRLKYTAVLEGASGSPGASRMRWDCLDGRKPTNTFLSVVSDRLPSPRKHELFDGTSDFYCSGLHRLLSGFKVGDFVTVKLAVELKQTQTGEEFYEQMRITDILLKPEGDGPVRSYRANPGTKVELISVEPVL